MNIIPVLRPTIEWQLLDGMCGFNVRAKTDASKRKWTESAQLLVALSGEREPARALRGAGLLAHSLSYGFAIKGYSPVMRGTHIRCYPLGDIVIAVGTLAEWRDCLIAMLREWESTEMRQCLGTIMVYLEHEGLGDLFQEYTKHMQPDGTFILR